jgi:hypothetical protein
MRRQTRKQWIGRVRRWERSGLDAETFAAREGVRARTLIWWRWRLGMGPRVTPSAAAVVSAAQPPSVAEARPGRATTAAAAVVSSTRREPTFVEVVLPATTPGSRGEQPGVALKLLVGRHRVLVPPGFDESTLRRLLGVLEDR